MSFGLLVLRIVLGLVMAGHGAQKLFGWFDGPGPQGCADMFGQYRFRAPMVAAILGGTAEFGGGLLVASGLVTPLGSLGIIAMMISAIVLVHWANGFWVFHGGYEFNLLIVAAAVALAATGPGGYSLDAAIGWDDGISGAWWGVGVLVGAALLSGSALAFGRSAPAASQHDAEEAESTSATSSPSNTATG